MRARTVRDTNNSKNRKAGTGWVYYLNGVVLRYNNFSKTTPNFLISCECPSGFRTLVPVFWIYSHVMYQVCKIDVIAIYRRPSTSITALTGCSCIVNNGKIIQRHWPAALIMEIFKDPDRQRRTWKYLYNGVDRLKCAALITEISL